MAFLFLQDLSRRALIVVGVLLCLLGGGAARAEGRRLPCSTLPGTSRGGGSGLFDLPVADPGCPWQLRFAVWGHGFVQYSFLLLDDRNEQISGALQLAATLGSHVEAWLQLGTRENRNQRPTTDGGTAQPALALGRTALGVKLHTPWGRLGHVAVQPLMRVHSGPFDFGPSFTTVDGGVDVLGSLDLAAILPRLPLRLSARIGYLHDRSSGVLASLDCMAQGGAQCLSARLIYTTAYDLGQPRVEVGLGAEAHFRVGAGMRLGPTASYRLAVVTGDGDPVLRAQLAVQAPGVPSDDINARVGQQLSLGARLQLPFAASIDLGFQLALSSWGYAMGAKLPQVAGFGALSFALDLLGGGRSHGEPVERAPQEPAPGVPAAQPTGLLRGVVRDAGSKLGLADAVVRFIGAAQNALLTDEHGGYQSGPLPAGPVAIEAGRGDHQTRRIVVVVRPGELISADIELGTSARLVPARLWVQGIDEAGAQVTTPMLATLSRAGGGRPNGDSASVEMSPQPEGLYARLPGGSWRLRVDAAGYLSHEQVLVLPAGEERRLSLRMLRRPQLPRARLLSDEIALAEPLAFGGEPGRPAPAPGSARLLDEVIDLLIHHPELTRIHIEAVGPADELQLIAVRDYLVQGGIAPERVRVTAPEPTSDPRRPTRIVLRIAQ